MQAGQAYFAKISDFKAHESRIRVFSASLESARSRRIGVISV
jgi:hypothetical protein